MLIYYLVVAFFFGSCRLLWLVLWFDGVCYSTHCLLLLFGSVFILAWLFYFHHLVVLLLSSGCVIIRWLFYVLFSVCFMYYSLVVSDYHGVVLVLLRFGCFHIIWQFAYVLVILVCVDIIVWLFPHYYLLVFSCLVLFFFYGYYYLVDVSSAARCVMIPWPLCNIIWLCSYNYLTVFLLLHIVILLLVVFLFFSGCFIIMCCLWL